MNSKILRLALPSIVSNITVPLLGLCDVTIMGHVGGATHIGAIAVGAMIFNVMYWLFGFLRMGNSGLTAQALGAGRRDEVLRLRRQGLLLGVGIGLLIILLQVPLQWFTFWLMQPTDEVYRLCIPYYYTCVWGAPAMLGLYSLTGWFIGVQNTRVPMAIAIGQNVLNILTSLTLVIAFGMGIEGVALGTLVSQWGAFVIALLISRRLKKQMSNEKGEMRNVNEEMRNGLRGVRKVYLNIFLRTLCLVAVNLYFTSYGAARGADILAANTLLMQFFMFFSYVMDGFAYAGEALAGKSYGARDGEGLRRVCRYLFAWGGGVALLFTLAYWLFGPWVLGLLTTDVAVIATACVYLPWAVLIPLAGTAAFVWDGIFIGITATRGMLISCAIAALAFFALYLTLSPTMGNHALWLALLVYLALRGIVQTCLMTRPTTLASLLGLPRQN